MLSAIQTIVNDGVFLFPMKSKNKNIQPYNLEPFFISPNKGLSVNFPQFQSPAAQPE